MRISLLSENINKNLPFISRAVSNRGQLPILLNFLLKARNGEFVISSTDLEIGIEGKIPASVVEEGETTIPAKAFLELLANMQAGKIDIYTKDSTLLIEGQKVKAQVQTQEASDFPRLYDEKGEKEMDVKKEIVEKEFKKVIFAASQEVSRPALSGLLIKNSEGGRVLVATDGYRLSLKTISQSGSKKKDEEKPILIPARLMRELLSLKEEADIEVFISSQSNQVIFSQGDMVLVGRLIEAEFPDYEKIIPSDFSSRATFEKGELQNAIKTCWVFAREASGIIRLSIQKGKIIVSAKTQSLGEGSVEVESKLEGEENEIAFNGRYVLELLANVDEETMVFEMTGPLNPGVFKVAGDDSFLHLIMPIRVQE